MAELYRVNTEAGATVVALFLPLTLDHDATDELADKILPLIEAKPGGQWIFELAGVEYLGSAALGFLVNVRQRVKSTDGKLALCGLSDYLTQLFQDTSLERLFLITRTRTEALKRLK